MPLRVWNGSSFTEVGYLKVWNGSSWVAASDAYTWDGSSWRRFFPSVRITNQIAVNFSRAGIGGTATATYRLRNDGVALRQQNTVLVPISGQWLVASGTTSDYEVQGTWSGSGGSVSGPTGWVNLGTTRDWSLTVTNSSATRDLNLEIRIAASGLVIATALIDFEVDSAP